MILLLLVLIVTEMKELRIPQKVCPSTTTLTLKGEDRESTKYENKAFHMEECYD